ncbi:uncharacterized protein M6B38_403810 [Iris pallida]|uniref:EF-hand domain-containing protein n=1 Tax=Iris pallida TaxID=29817 RepID=A0AAX6FRV7_IRIPA|nr:uncharacterized protein M6B38_403810 [Iris pallida]
MIKLKKKVRRRVRPNVQRPLMILWLKMNPRNLEQKMHQRKTQTIQCVKMDLQLGRMRMDPKQRTSQLMVLIMMSMTTEEDEEEEDPEEIIEDDQEMEDVLLQIMEFRRQHGGNVAKSATESEKPTIEVNNGEKSIDVMSNKNHEKGDDKQSETVKTDSGREVVVHEEVLQAFRYFDRNRVGYIKVEDLRCLIHNLGKFLSHRDVKEMIQSALFESNSARDNRIFYKKLVRLTDI